MPTHSSKGGRGQTWKLDSLNMNNFKRFIKSWEAVENKRSVMKLNVSKLEKMARWIQETDQYFPEYVGDRY